MRLWELKTNHLPATLKKTKNNVELHNVFAVAEKLHKTVEEILQMSVFEFNMWIAYFDLQNDEIKQQQQLAKMKK